MHFRQTYVARLDRLWKPVTRPEGTATGLVLPCPSPVCFAGHHQAFKVASGDRYLTLACLAGRSSAWHFNANGNFGPAHPRHLCLCGDQLPSRPHLAWGCPCLPVPASIPLPTDRAGERLFALPGAWQPAPPFAVDLEGFLDKLRDALVPCLQRRRLYAATDGSSKAGVGAMAWAHNTLATGDALEDQSPFRCEVTAVAMFLQALEAASQIAKAQGLCCCQEVYCIIDCSSAISVVRSGCSDDLHFVTQEAAACLKRLDAGGIRVTMLHMPSNRTGSLSILMMPVFFAK